MKKLLFLILFLSVKVEAKQIILDIPDRDIEIVERSVVDAEEWIKAAWAGKLNKCKERLVNKEVGLSIEENQAIPAGKEAIIDRNLDRPKEVREEIRSGR